MDRGGLQSMGSQRVRHDLITGQVYIIISNNVLFSNCIYKLYI